MPEEVKANFTGDASGLSGALTEIKKAAEAAQSKLSEVDDEIEKINITGETSSEAVEDLGDSVDKAGDEASMSDEQFETFISTISSATDEVLKFDITQESSSESSDELSQSVTKLSSTVESLSESLGDVVSSNSKVSASQKSVQSSTNAASDSVEEMADSVNKSSAALGGLSVSSITAGGALDILDGQLDDAGDEADDAAGDFTQAAGAAELLSLQSSALSINVGLFTIALRNLTTQIPILVTSVGNLTAAFTGLATAIAGVGLGGFVVALGGALATAQEAGANLNDFESVMNSLEPVSQDVQEALLDAFMPVIEAQGAIELFDRLIQTLIHSVSDFSKVIAGTFEGEFLDGSEEDMQSLGTTVSQILDSVNENVGRIAAAFADVTMILGDEIASIIDTLLTSLPGFLRGIATATEQVISIVDEASGGISVFVEQLTTLGRTIAAGIAPILSSFFEILGTIVDQLIRTDEETAGLAESATEAQQEVGAFKIETIALAAKMLALLVAINKVASVAGALVGPLASVGGAMLEVGVEARKSGNALSAFFNTVSLGVTRLLGASQGITKLAAAFEQVLPPVGESTSRLSTFGDALENISTKESSFTSSILAMSDAVKTQFDIIRNTNLDRQPIGADDIIKVNELKGLTDIDIAQTTLPTDPIDTNDLIRVNEISDNVKDLEIGPFGPFDIDPVDSSDLIQLNDIKDTVRDFDMPPLVQEEDFINLRNLRNNVISVSEFTEIARLDEPIDISPEGNAVDVSKLTDDLDDSIRTFKNNSDKRLNKLRKTGISRFSTPDLSTDGSTIPSDLRSFDLNPNLNVSEISDNIDSAISTPLIMEGEILGTIQQSSIENIVPEGAFGSEELDEVDKKASSVFDQLKESGEVKVFGGDDIGEDITIGERIGGQAEKLQDAAVDANDNLLGLSNTLDNIKNTNSNIDLRSLKDIDFGDTIDDVEVAPERLDNATDRLGNVLDSGFDSTDFGLEKAFHDSERIHETLTQIGRQNPKPFSDINTSSKEVLESLGNSFDELPFGNTTEKLNEGFEEVDNTINSVNASLRSTHTVSEGIEDSGISLGRETFAEANDEIGEVNEQFHTMERLSMNVNASIEGFFGQAERIPMLADDLDGLGEQVRSTLGVSMIQGIDNVEDVEKAMEGLSDETDLTDDELEELGNEMEDLAQSGTLAEISSDELAEEFEDLDIEAEKAGDAVDYLSDEYSEYSAQATISAAATKLFSGAALTLTGVLSTLGIAIGVLTGAFLVLVAAVGTVGALLGAVGESGKSFEQIIKTVKNALIDFGQKAMPFVVASTNLMLDVFRSVATVGGEIIGAFRDIGVALGLVEEKTGSSKSGFEGFLQTVDSVAKASKNLLNKLENIVTEFAGDLATNIRDAGDAFSQFLEDINAKEILSRTSGFLSDISDAVGGITGAIDKFLGFVGDLISGLIKITAIVAILTAIIVVLTGSVGVLVGILGTVATVIGGIFGGIPALIAAIIAVVVVLLERLGVLDAILAALMIPIDLLVAGFMLLVDVIVGIGKAIASISFVSDFIDGIIKDVKDTVAAFDLLIDFIGTAGHILGQVFNVGLDMFIGGILVGVEALIELVNELIQFSNEAISTLSEVEFLGVSLGSVFSGIADTFTMVIDAFLVFPQVFKSAVVDVVDFFAQKLNQLIDITNKSIRKFNKNIASNSDAVDTIDTIQNIKLDEENNIKETKESAESSVTVDDENRVSGDDVVSGGAVALSGIKGGSGDQADVPGQNGNVTVNEGDTTNIFNQSISAEPEDEVQMGRIAEDAMQEANSFKRRQQGSQ